MNNLRKQVTKSGKIIEPHDDSGSHHFFNNDPTIKKIGGGWPGVGEGPNGGLPLREKMKPAIAKRFLNMVWVYYRRIVRLRHD